MKLIVNIVVAGTGNDSRRGFVWVFMFGYCGCEGPFQTYRFSQGNTLLSIKGFHSGRSGIRQTRKKESYRLPLILSLSSSGSLYIYIYLYIVYVYMYLKSLDRSTSCSSHFRQTSETKQKSLDTNSV